MAESTSHQVILATRRDRAALADVAALALLEKPLSAYVLPGHSYRLKALTWFANREIEHGLQQGEVYTAPELDGVAVWKPPGKAFPNSLQMIRAGVLAMPLHFGVTGLIRYVKAMRRLEKLHRRYMPGQHWYLLLAAVRPENQRSGLGSALLLPVLSKADASALPCYLACDSEEGVEFFRGHGFEVVAEAKIAKGLRFWTMVRQPQGLSAE